MRRRRRPAIVVACVVAALTLSAAAGTTVATAQTAKTPTAVTAVAAPTTPRQETKQNSGIKRNTRNLHRARLSIQALAKILGTTNNNVKLLQTLAAGLPPVLTQLGTGLQAAANGLTQLAAGVTALKTAIEDPTTGLVGLNNARPQFGAWEANGTFIDGTGAHPPASGPSDDAVVHPSAGKYVVDFGNDVSARALVVTLFPAATAPIGQVVDCAANATATATCAALGDGTGDDPGHVLVTTEGFTPGITALDESFEVTALSG